MPLNNMGLKQFLNSFYLNRYHGILFYKNLRTLESQFRVYATDCNNKYVPSYSSVETF